MALRPAALLSIGVLVGACFDPPDPREETETEDGTTAADDTTTTAPPPADSSSSDPTTPPGTTMADTTSDDTTGPPPVDSSSSGGDSDETAAGEPDVEVIYEGATVVSGELFRLAPNPAVGAMETVVVTVENAGTDTLEVGGLLPVDGDLDDFSIDQSRLDGLIDPGESSEFSIVMQPTAGGFRQANFELLTNDPDESPFIVSVQGHTEPNTYRPIATPVAPTPRFNHAMATTQDGTVLLFGGRGNDGERLNDTWLYDPAAEDWVALTPANSPTIRDAHNMAWLGDERVILFGGNDMGGSTSPGFGDTWQFDTDSEAWFEVFLVGATPPARYQHSMVALGDSALLFGGRGGGDDFADVWIYDGASQSWLSLFTTGTAPAARATAAMGFDGDDRVTVFGGFDNFTPLNDTFNLQVSTGVWSVSASPPIAGARAVLQAEYFGPIMSVFSGKLDSCCVNPSPGTFHYDSGTDIWTNVTPAVEPPALFNYDMALLPDRNVAILFGGQTLNGGPGSSVDQTWEYTGPIPPL